MKVDPDEERSMPEPGSRVDGVTIVKPIVFGSYSQFLGKKSPGEHSHAWTIYVRSYDGLDMSHFIEKVLFELHPSCSIPNVQVDYPPFQVSQTGWGEFEAKITIYFKENLEKPIVTSHFLKLFPDPKNAPTSSSLLNSITPPVITETYEELIFTNPSRRLLEIFDSDLKLPETGFEKINKYFISFRDEEADTLTKILEANEFIKHEILDTIKLLESTKAA